MAKVIAGENMKEKVKRALKLLKARKVTIRKAATLAGVSYREMVDLTSKAGIDIGYTLKDLWEDMQKFQKRRVNPNQLAKDLEAMENG